MAESDSEAGRNLPFLVRLQVAFCRVIDCDVLDTMTKIRKRLALWGRKVQVFNTEDSVRTKARGFGRNQDGEEL